jgi:hypothetical protein
MTLQSPLGYALKWLRGKRRKDETPKEFRDRMTREEALERQRDRDPSLGMDGRKMPVRYEE